MRRNTWRGAFTAAVAYALVDAVPASAAQGGMFPVQSHLVPFVVAGAFILPAAIAAVTSGLKRIARSPTALVGAGLAALGAVALAANSPGVRSVLGV